METVLTVDEVKARVVTIRDMAGDAEAAHSHEDQLHQTVLAAIAENRCDDPQACAAAALATQKIEFARWCA